MDHRGTIPVEHHSARGSNLQPMVASRSELNAQENSPKLFLLPVESSTLRNQARKEQFQNRNEFYIASQSNNGNFSAISNGPLQAYSLFADAEPPCLPLARPCNARGGNAELRPDFQDLTRFARIEGNMFQECRNIAAIADSRSAGSSPSGASTVTENREADGFLLDEAQFGSTLNTSYCDSHKESDQGHLDIDMKCMKNLEASDVKNLGKNVKDNDIANNFPAKIADGHGKRIDQSSDSFKLDDKGQLHATRLATAVAEKLWEGSLLLNSSVTVSAEAYFKSGERIPEVNWTEFVEVKGKVRLEAFEKYIQDLPRSRSRGLMVVSLCRKNGSSETGLSGMKEVGEKYKQGNKVGLAKLPEGVDLYICPRSDTIFTILAKYGFFKGMAAIEDNPDSLIGCAVWRKNRPLNATAKISDPNLSSSKPLTSASGSAAQQAVESAQNAKQTVDNAEKVTIKENVGPENPLSSIGSDVTKPCTPAISDDDLPEFDFKIAPKVSQALSSNPLDAPNPNKRPAPESYQKMTLPNHLSASPILPRHLINANPGMQPLKRARECESQFPTPETEGMPFSTIAAQRKNIFDDDDNDMPEWQPPGHIAHKESAPETTKLSSSSFVPTETLNSTHESLLLGFPRFAHPPSAVAMHPPSTVAMRPPFPSSCPFTVKSPQARPVNGRVQRGSLRPSMVSNPNPLWRPPPKPSDVKLPFHHHPWNHWKQ